MTKRTKHYIETDLAKKKVARYKFWSIKDENGITICSNEENNPNQDSFGEVMDRIIADNVDAEVQVKYGSNEQSSRNNPPFFIRINEEIEWVEPEEETVTINGTPHKVDKNGNVNINFATPEVIQQPEIKVESARIDTVQQEMEIRLAGIQREHELAQEKMALDTQNKLAEQMLQFKEMMLSDRETRLSEREAEIARKEAELKIKETEIRENVTGYLKQVPSALGGLIKEFAKPKEKPLGEAKEEKPRKKRRAVTYSITPSQPLYTQDEADHEDEEITSFAEASEDKKEEIIENNDHEHVQD